MIALPFDFLGWALLFIALPGLRWRPANVTARGCLLLLLLVPLSFGESFSHVSLLAMLRGLFGGLSMATVSLLLALALQNVRGKSVFTGQEARWLPLLIAVTALLFYPPALGLGMLDPYAWGYDAAALLPLTVGALAWAAWLAGWRVSALALVLALAAWRLRLLESTNLWDYLLDPLLAFTVLGLFFARGVRCLWRTRRASRRAASAS
ncbi:MAG: hypothetical protein LBQ81_05775 [Zoogloeaceae bacterium]|nr:hypothetical protein [Zoogloeaceae bacterium]